MKTIMAQPGQMSKRNKQKPEQEGNEFLSDDDSISDGAGDRDAQIDMNNESSTSDEDEDFVLTPKEKAKLRKLNYPIAISPRGKNSQKEKEMAIQSELTGKISSESTGKTPTHQFRRVRHFDIEKAGGGVTSADLSRIELYLMAVKNSRSVSLFQLTSKMQNVLPIDELICERREWHRIDELSPALARWLGSHSIELLVRGSVPTDFDIEQIRQRVKKEKPPKVPKPLGRPRKTPAKDKDEDDTPKRRGRPPKMSSNVETSPSTKTPVQERPKTPKLTTYAKPMTINEQLHSLVSASISNKQQGRRTNNSLNAELSSTAQLTPVPAPPQTSNSSEHYLHLSPLKRPKLEVMDFELPPEFRTIRSKEDFNSNVSAVQFAKPRLPQNRRLPLNDQQPSTSRTTLAPHEMPSTSQNNHSNSSLDSPSNLPATKLGTKTNKEANKPEESRSKSKEQNGETPKNAPKRDRKQIQTPPTPSIKGVQIGEEVEEERQHLSIFTARAFPFDVDMAPAVKRFESSQVVDIFHSLPDVTDPQTKQEANEKDTDQCRKLTRKLDRLVLLQGKQRQRHAQALFCGGPLAAIAVCPRAMRSDRELIAIGTFCDETLLNMKMEEGTNQNAFVQLWTSNPRDLTELAQLLFLLQVPNAQNVCSLNWCPVVQEDFIALKSRQPQTSNPNPSPVKAGSSKRKPQTPQRIGARNSNSSAADNQPSSSGMANGPQPNDSGSPLGLLAVATSIGRVHVYRIPYELDALRARHSNKDDSSSLPLVLESSPLLTLSHPQIWVAKGGEQQTTVVHKKKPKVEKSPKKQDASHGDCNGDAAKGAQLLSDSIPIFCVQWSPFSGGRLIAGVSAANRVFVWDISRRDRSSQQPHIEPFWDLHSDEWQSPPVSVCWLAKDKICVSFRHRAFRMYRLTASESDPGSQGSVELVYECNLQRTCGTQCYSQPLAFPGLLSYDAITFSLFGMAQQAPSYIWLSVDKDGEGQVCATTLSNCHQIRNGHLHLCDRTGICTSVGADGRLVASLNGRMAPNEGLQRDSDSNFMLGRTLLQLIGHDKVAPPDEKKREFCFSNADCCQRKWLEVRLGDCALLEQENERICRRPQPEVCMDRRMEALTVVDVSHRSAGLTYCGGESGIVFIVPCTL